MKASKGPLLNFPHKEIAHLVLQIKIPADVARQIETILTTEAISKGAEVDLVSDVCAVKRETEKSARSIE
jgi:hypothetical protein